MQNHTLILSTAKLHIPEQVNIDFVIDLINRGLTSIEYFGKEIDNQADYIDEEMQRKIDTTTFININCESKRLIDYENTSSDYQYAFIMQLLNSRKNPEIITDEKDITINLGNS